MSEETASDLAPDDALNDARDGDAGLGGPNPKPDFRERRRLDEVFGETLPTITSDERDPEPADGAERERWYRENRPPHHG
ncbi:MAG TPA: hypothetical protein VIJ00_17730 [Nakamurella sp.]